LVGPADQLALRGKGGRHVVTGVELALRGLPVDPTAVSIQVVMRTINDQEVALSWIPIQPNR
jgi:hypothetical protein